MVGGWGVGSGGGPDDDNGCDYDDDDAIGDNVAMVM